MIVIKNKTGCDLSFCSSWSTAKSYKCYFCDKTSTLYLCAEHTEYSDTTKYKHICRDCEPKTKIFPEVGFEYIILFWRY